MTIWSRLKTNLSGIGNSFVRYPITVFWLVALSVVNAVAIEGSLENYGRLLFTVLTGALLSAVAQQIYEHFYKEDKWRWGLQIGAVILTGLYYFSLPGNDVFELAYSIRTVVLLFALFISFIWIPTIKNQIIVFHQNFLAILKNLFITLLFAGVLMLGVFAILSSVRELLFTFDYNVLVHSANIIWCLFAPLYFLALVPKYEEEETLSEAFIVPRFLEILILYIVIPIVAVYTIILLAYILLNISGDFWTDNLLEPLLVTYSISVIVVYLLSCNIDHKVSLWFRKVFPKVMLPIVLFQTIASVLKIQEMGITHGRYYVILFGLFATLSGIIFSFFPPRRNGWMALVLLVLAVISVVPPIDAFSVARNNQLSRLEDTLDENGMLEDGTLTPKSDLPQEDKVVITKSVDYLYYMDYLDEVNYLPEQFNPYSNFETVFGFPMVYSTDVNDVPSEVGNYAYLDWQENSVVALAGADYMVHANASNNGDPFQTAVGDDYTLIIEEEEPYLAIRLENEESEELMTADLTVLFEQAFEAISPQNNMVVQDDMTAVFENEQVKLTVLAVDLSEYSNQISADMFIFITIK